MKLSGRIFVVGEARSGVNATSGAPWKRQEFVIETNESFPKKVAFTTKREDIIGKLVEGTDVTVDFWVQSRSYEGRWYTELQAVNVTQGGAINEPTERF